MKAPDFWWRPPGLAAALLGPAALAYGAAAAARMKLLGVDPGMPVVCIGNVTVGGSGKTPTALAVAALLRGMGRTPAFLLRGYRGRLPGPIRVDPGAHRYDEVGDEALLLARHGATIVARDRPAGARLCRALGADVVVMDDGLQNPSLRKTLSVAVFDGGCGIGNGRVLPAGPLRGPLHAQWPRIDAGLVVGDGEPGHAIARTLSDRGMPALRARLEPDAATRDGLRGRRVLAFAGIGRPSKFFATLAECGAEIVERRAFPDHHSYSAAEGSALADAADALSAILVTTEKDAVRLAPLVGAEPRLAALATLPVTLVFATPDDIIRLLSQALAARQPGPLGNGLSSRRRTASGEA